MLLIPFGMGNTIAQEVPGEEEDTTGPVGVVDEALTVDTVIQRYKLSIMEEEDAAQRQAYETVVDRLEIAKAIYQLTNDQRIDDRFIDKTVVDLFAMLDATYGPEAFDESSIPTSGHGVRAINTAPHNSDVTIDVNYVHVSIQSEHSCATNSSVSGTTRSTMTSFSNGDATISVEFDYPEDFDENIRVLRNTNCYDFDHDETVKRHDVLAATVPGSGQVPAQACTLKADRASETESRGCNAFGPDRIVLISASNTYDSDEISRDVQLGWTTTSWLFT